jgi:hypothetical protein
MIAVGGNGFQVTQPIRTAIKHDAGLLVLDQ